MSSGSSDRGIERRAALHAALGDAHRLAIVEALALGDRSPSELGEALDIRSNLLAHHLLVLGHAELIETVRSAGDGRRRYVKLRSAALDELRMPRPPLRPSLILFVCSANSARSPVAAALWRQRSDVPATSAGTHPAQRVHPLAVAAASHAGLDITGERPRPVEAVEGTPDLVITVCDEANEELEAFAGVPRLHWSTPDPVAAGGAEAFERTVSVLTERVQRLAATAEQRKGTRRSPAAIGGTEAST